MAFDHGEYSIEMSRERFQHGIFIDNSSNGLDDAVVDGAPVWHIARSDVVCIPLERAESSTLLSSSPFSGPPFTKFRVVEPDDPLGEKYFMILYRPDERLEEYRRIGILCVTRNLANTLWEAEPSCFSS